MTLYLVEAHLPSKAQATVEASGMELEGPSDEFANEVIANRMNAPFGRA
jgi:hypothetical protein